MKKLIVGLLAAFLMASGLVAFSGTSATAACPYTSCINTNTALGGPASVRKGKKATFNIKVTAKRGTAKPVGRIKVTIKKNGGGYSQVVNKSVSGARSVKAATRKLTKVGTYTVTVKYTPKAGSVFKASTKKKTFRVKR
ncbi:hypothetical protein LRP67_06555 [Nocardioides sp. cx-169]|uniref:hypothetical protein n=1 Tax=Nocardioides sp. cx-169 TaxID=2899080 RepID=UPI001E448753|nr:hypothetical protein [Nocardioides sp. cx-169]MCD4533738.1 hypothetical protein [Nocardioides sp. cx-169]